MTLDTRVIVHDATAAKPVWDYCRTLIGGQDAKWDTTGEHWPNPGWHNLPGQGLPALLWFFYGSDGGPLLRDSECYCDEMDGEKCGPCRRPDGFIEVSFDTAYGYTGPNGEGCGDLHAALVDRLGTWLDERGLTWSWENEFTGEWHVGREGLYELGDGGRAALEWFASEVLPAVVAHARSTA